MFGWNRKYEHFMFGWNGKYENLMKYKVWKMRKYENICREGIPWRGGLLVGRWWVEPLGHWVNNRPSWGGTHPCPHYICQLSRNYEDHPSGLLISAEYANWVLAGVWGVFLSNIFGRSRTAIMYFHLRIFGSDFCLQMSPELHTMKPIC